MALSLNVSILRDFGVVMHGLCDLDTLARAAGLRYKYVREVFSLPNNNSDFCQGKRYVAQMPVCVCVCVCACVCEKGICATLKNIGIHSFNC